MKSLLVAYWWPIKSDLVIEPSKVMTAITFIEREGNSSSKYLKSSPVTVSLALSKCGGAFQGLNRGINRDLIGN